MPCPRALLFSLCLLFYDPSDAEPTRSAIASLSGRSLTSVILPGSYHLYHFRTHLRDTPRRYAVPMCLRNRGFTLLFSLCLLVYDLILIGIPPDIAWRGYIYSIARRSYAKRQVGLANLLCSIFAVLHGRLEAIASGNYFQLALRIACR